MAVVVEKCTRGKTVVMGPTVFNAVINKDKAWYVETDASKWIKLHQGQGAGILVGGDFGGLWTVGLQQCVAIVYLF